jgi:post-segregation antitoxin (ccd killing protein)
MPPDANAMNQKGNVVLYLDKELVEKSKELGFNLSKTFENHLKQTNQTIINIQFTKQLQFSNQK